MSRLLLIATTVLVLTLGSVSCATSQKETPRNYRQDMRDFVQDISTYAKSIEPDFIVIAQNGHDLLFENNNGNRTLAVAYMDAIDGVGREDLLYGYNDDNVATPISERDYFISFMDIAETNGVEVLVTDYCSTRSFVDDSYNQNAARGYISFAADHRDLDNIPAYPLNPFNMNSANVTSLAETKNFLYLINPDSYSTITDFLNAIRNTNYDVILIDAFHEGDVLTTEDISDLKSKANGGTRLVIAYMSIGEAEDYRHYWLNEWKSNPPSWLANENPNWPGNYKVRYWDPAWQEIIYGNDTSYLGNILDAGFNGVYLDIIDAFEYFEN